MGEHMELSPTEMEIKLLKNAGISESSILATAFPKIIKNSIFLLNFYQKISKISQNFQIFRVFRPNVRKINACFLKLFSTYAKNSLVAILCRILLTFFQNSQASMGGGALCTRTPYEANPLECSPSNRNPGGVAHF